MRQKQVTLALLFFIVLLIEGILKQAHLPVVATLIGLPLMTILLIAQVWVLLFSGRKSR